MHVVHADALHLPFPDRSFDFVYSRFLLQHMGQACEAISEMVRVCKSGGRILLQDLDGQFLWHFPESHELSQMIAAVVPVLARSGFDPFVGRKLYTYAHRAGLGILDVRVAPYHAIFGAADEQTLARWRLKLDIARPRIEEILGPDRAERLLDIFISQLEDPESITYSVQFTILGIKPL
jgi:SAM-dependent methyltransferase